MKDKIELCKFPVDWQSIDNLIERLVTQINESNWQPTAIIGIARGGLIPAVKLSNVFDVPLTTVNVSLRDKRVDRTAHSFDLDNEFLLVEDIIDTGKTISTIHKMYRTLNFRTASLFKKITSDVPCDYIGKTLNTEDSKYTWIVFPWETNCIKEE